MIMKNENIIADCLPSIFFVFIQTFSPEQENLATGFSNRNFLADGEIEIQENNSKPRDDGDGEEEMDLNQGNQ